jgi:tetratricopeptide (TPR) repeat protein
MPRTLRVRLLLLALMGAALSACATHEAGAPGSPARPAGESAAGTARPGPPVAVQPERPYTPPTRQFRLGTAASALVAQARQQAGGGEYGPAAATLERALGIEPDNPLLWIELGRVRLGENNAPQADAMGRKALTLATGDAAAQAGAWRLIADALRVRGRNPDASEAERRADTLAPR